MRRVFVFVLLVVFVFPLLAENASNVRVQQKGYRGDTVVITYDLSKMSDVRLLMSTDMSNDFNVLDQVTGHVGKGIAAGVNRTIMWFPLQEYDRFYADNVRFQVEAVSNDLPLTVSKSQISAPSSGATEYITVTCSKPWVIQYASGSMYNAVRSGNSVKVVISANTSSARNDFFYIRTTDDAEKLKISLSQSGKVYSSSSSSRTSSSRPSSSTSSSSSSNTTKEPTIGTENGYQYVDLGLSVKWATCNVGALDPSDYGDYYRFGETTPKNKYSGTYDGCPSYSFSVDAASVKWGGRWRMPTASQVEELTRECTWTLITLDGVAGYNVKGKNGNSIFIPLAGYIHEANNHATGVGERGFYWTSTSKTPGSTWYRLVFYKSGGIHTSCNVWGNPQYGSFAHPIRPVCP